MPIDPSHLSQEYRGDLSALTVHAENVRIGLDVLLTDWLRLRTSSARCTVDPLVGITFAPDAVEAVITARLTGTPFVLPTAKGK
jgi:hypothetical protein